MKRSISFLVLLIFITHLALSQQSPDEKEVFVDTIPKPVLLSDKSISIGLLIGDNQTFNEKVYPDVVISTPTIINVQENANGEKYVKVYVNMDHINIICSGIGLANQKAYQAYKQLLPPGKSGIDDKFASPINFQISNNNPTILEDAKLNEEKEWLYNCKFNYFIKDKTGRKISSLTLEFVFPRPEPAFFAINDSLINKIRNRPVEEYVFKSKDVMRYKKEVSLANEAHTKSNDTTRLPTKLVLRSDIHSIIFWFKPLNCVDIKFLEYTLNDDIWKTTGRNMYPFILLDDLQPGKYKLQVRYPGQAASVFTYEFEVAPVWTQTTSFKIIAGSAVTAFFCVLLFFVNAKYQRRKLRNEIYKRTQLQNQITSLQTRLQPHFIFNTLNSIQGLINKKNIEEANVYIAKFGALLHEIIGKSDKSMHPLTIEIKQVEYYLQLEQLRFKFQYAILIDANINTDETDIPTMLLQPFVENAIKHGIIEKKDEGVIEISIGKNESNLVIEIRDNGKGYDTNSANEGRGNAMIEERINALNELLNDQKIVLAIRSAMNVGTCVSLNFYNWI